MLDSIYHMTLKLLFGGKMLTFCYGVRSVVMPIIYRECSFFIEFILLNLFLNESEKW